MSTIHLTHRREDPMAGDGKRIGDVDAETIRCAGNKDCFDHGLSSVLTSVD
jgi:hypothetical protein